jgi:hypothetical protein
MRKENDLIFDKYSNNNTNDHEASSTSPSG